MRRWYCVSDDILIAHCLLTSATSAMILFRCFTSGFNRPPLTDDSSRWRSSEVVNFFGKLGKVAYQAKDGRVRRGQKMSTYIFSLLARF